MNIFKTIFGNKRSRVWAIVTVALVVLLVVVDVLAMHFSNIISIFLGGDRPYEVDAEDAVVYYEKSTASKDEANEQARAVTREIAEEGTIMLKNNGALPLTGTGLKVSVFGKNSVNLVYGGSGSGGGDTTFEKKTIFESLTAAGLEFNPELKAFYEDDSRSGDGRSENPSDLDSGETVAIETGETPAADYPDDAALKLDEYDDAAIVVISRVGGEGFDLPMDEAYGARHYLSLDSNERDLLKNVAEKFEKVIVVLNTLNAMETGFLDEYGVDACLWIGGPGSTGIMALGDILTGKVTPSGRTTDTWAADFTLDPTWNNFSERGYKGGDRYYNTDTGRDSEYYFVNYEESVYVGYRYYETRAAQERETSGNDDWYKANVRYPFGYGESYTTFDWSVDDASSIEDVAISADGRYEISVTVTNTGAYKGKDVVQVYAKLPYTSGGPEKPYEVLVGYAKTPVLYPESGKAAIKEDAAGGEDKPNSCTVTVTVDPYDFATYDYKGASGFEGYVIEEGDYSLLVSRDAHTPEAEIPFTVSADITYREDPDTGAEVVNRYTDTGDEAFDSDAKLEFLMSRDDLSVLPDAPKEADRQVNSAFLEQIADVSHNNPEAEKYTELPSQGGAASTPFASLIQYDDETGRYYADYDNDNVWNAILDALTVKEMADMFNQGAFQTLNITAINKPLTLESDGPVGWCNFISSDDTWKGNNAYCSQVVMSATWNTELIEKMGECVGEEGLWGAARTEDADGLSYSGWYAPGVNIHRSPFGGRNFEYFSEDPFLTGTIAAAEIRGCRSKGVYCYVKHFALNEQETHRNGGCSWVTEQAMREIYLKPFEMAVKDGGTTALMSSFNRIGTRWTGGDYRLLTEILRDEWGFRGTVICDYNQTGNYMDNRQMIYAGGDLNLCSDKSRMWTDYDSSSAADVTVLRRAAKNVMYTVANSNAINNLNYRYSMAIWKILLIVGNCVIAAGLIVWGVFAVRGALKKSKSVRTSESETDNDVK